MRDFAWTVLLGAVCAQGTPVTLPYNYSVACQWPKCAPTCGLCDLRPIFFAGTDNAICHMEVCICKPPYCAQGNSCVSPICQLGAVPPPHNVTPWTRWFGGLAPADEPPASFEAWAAYAQRTASRLPLALAIAGCVAGVFTTVCLCSGLEQKCGCLPKSPVLVLIWAGLLATSITMGLMHSQRKLSLAYDYGVKQVEMMHTDLEHLASQGLRLNASCAQMQSGINALPSSCRWSLVKYAANGFVDLGNKATASKWKDVVKATDTMMVANRTSGKALHALSKFRWYAIHMPLLPTYAMLVGCIAMGIATVVWGLMHVSGRMTDVAELVVLRCGDVCIPLLAVVSGILAAIYLAAGLVAGKFCVDVDANMLALARSTNWSAHAHVKEFDVNIVMANSAMYYIYGNTSNPVISMMQAALSATHLMDRAVQDAQHAESLAGNMCNGITDLNSAAWLNEIDGFIANMTRAASAAYMWPYYDGFVRVSLCQNTMGALGSLFLVSAVLGLFCFPIFGLLSEYDLEEWVSKYQKMHPDADDDHMEWGH